MKHNTATFKHQFTYKMLKSRFHETLATNPEHILRLQYDLCQRLFWLEQHTNTLSDEQIATTHSQLNKFIRCLTNNTVTPDDVEAHKVFWDFEDNNISRWISEFLMTYWIDAEFEWPQALSLTMDNAAYECRQVLTPMCREIGSEHEIFDTLEYAEEKWLLERLDHLLSRQPEQLWSMDESDTPQDARIETFYPLQFVKFIEAQRTHHPNARKHLLADLRVSETLPILNPTDEQQIWCIHVHDLKLNMLNALEPAARLKNPPTEWIDRFNDLGWTHAWVRVADPDQRAPLIMVKQAHLS